MGRMAEAGTEPVAAVVLAVLVAVALLLPVAVASIVQMMIVCNTPYPSLATPRCPVVSTHGDARNLHGDFCQCLSMPSPRERR